MLQDRRAAVRLRMLGGWVWRAVQVRLNPARRAGIPAAKVLNQTHVGVAARARVDNTVLALLKGTEMMYAGISYR